MSETNKIEFAKPFSINCPKCGHLNVFDQPYVYHAGFADTGFLYNDYGNQTLVWNVFDSEFVRFFGEMKPSVFQNKENVKAFEDWLPNAPFGGRWKFGNPARCLSCKSEIAPPMGRGVNYVIYVGSIVADSRSKGEFKSLKDVKEKLTC